MNGSSRLSTVIVTNSIRAEFSATYTQPAPRGQRTADKAGKVVEPLGVKWTGTARRQRCCTRSAFRSIGRGDAKQQRTSPVTVRDASIYFAKMFRLHSGLRLGPRRRCGRIESAQEHKVPSAAS